ncbi:MAG TPA: VanZ family protein [Bdellovibrionota bacterium]|jgi:hypothetical protein
MNSKIFESAGYRLFAWVLVLGYMGLIFHLSSKPSIPLPMWFPNQDKIYHFLEYHILAFLSAHATARGSHKKRFWTALTLASVYALTDEFHQSYVPGRDSSFGDWAADACGAWFGAFLYLRSETLLRRARQNAPRLETR